MKINKILAIAINDYDDTELNKIQNCKLDLTAIIDVLSSKYTFEDIEFIHEKKSTTRKALFNKLNTYFINSIENENILLLYAGHGEYNPELETAYWQPSDSDPLDSSTWLSVADILTFIKASKAFHISVVFDSCFSGAIFEEPKRGGGITAFESRKSRLGLTSGGLEKVSDGKTEELSPFAPILTKLLKENNLEELPFNILANNLILEFNNNRNQTPMSGTLINVGHEGGSFIFKLRKETEIIKNENEFLNEKLKNLFIPISKEDIQTIKKIQPINTLKHQVVKKQKYDEATKLRDEELKLQKEIYDRCYEYIDSLHNSIKYSEAEIIISKKLDEDLIQFEESIQSKNKEIEKVKDRLNKEAIDKGEEITPEKKEEIKRIAIIMASGPSIFRSKPDKLMFDQKRDAFLKAYNNNILKVYEEFLRLKANSKSDFLKAKASKLKEIIVNLYKYQIELLIKGYTNDFDEIIKLRELDISLLNWIGDKE
ncbi:UvrB/UvrC motif-containing protein [Cellulophaga baltica]|uniref:UvrB/uvrC motif-containing protein n=1 Tax=Cellulophaga baltica TaxID=76594 RepID=A0A1G7MCN4_9FLAO|nr:caspase family protein [Cellulophaga baltica]SDF59364.1 UvrB/uvrC motif-containing protein [Cellulophaga baltica]